jgi:two-component system phosphate regulon sensor histidine kinase PhoR
LSNNVLRENDAIKNDPRLSRYSAIIQQQSERLNEHVEKVLSIARIDDHQFVLHKESVDLHSVIEELIHSKDAELAANGVDLKLELNATHPVVLADKLHLSNVLYNLLDNAIKYADGNPAITMKTEDTPKHVLFSIQDNGIGISAEHQKHLFTKFFRVPTGNVHNVKGFGLGLFYVKRIAEQHKWKINVESEEGKGTRMEIAF